jgi:hypothetical protein
MTAGFSTKLSYCKGEADLSIEAERSLMMPMMVAFSSGLMVVLLFSNYKNITEFMLIIS